MLVPWQLCHSQLQEWSLGCWCYCCLALGGRGIQGGQLGDERPGLHPAVDLGPTIHCPQSRHHSCPLDTYFNVNTHSTILLLYVSNLPSQFIESSSSVSSNNNDKVKCGIKASVRVLTRRFISRVIPAKVVLQEVGQGGAIGAA